ncbi:MAG TPA: helix-turn-helix domain-containing protein [Candidatus Bathyarchaeia archaeon]|nr:helix-turn-helix domain-containing protein [Candidatus Bathyarchaeia archaeon]
MPVPGSLKRKPVDEFELVDTLEKQFGLPRDETRAYLHLLKVGSLTIDQVAELFGITANDAGSLLERMVSRGLIIRGSSTPPIFVPLHPRMTLTNIFKLYEKEVVQGLRDRRATVDRVVNLLTPIYGERKR